MTIVAFSEKLLRYAPEFPEIVVLDGLKINREDGIRVSRAYEL